jgi:hypothetical protein
VLAVSDAEQQPAAPFEIAIAVRGTVEQRVP